MNLVKNGAVLLAALSTFAITSCGPKTKTLTKEEAREFLKDAAKKEDIEAKYKVKDEKFTWNCSVKGTGMKPGEEGCGKYGIVQFMLGYLVDDSKFDPKTLDDFKELDELLKNFEKLKDEHTSTVNAGEDAGWSGALSFVNQDGFDRIVGDVEGRSAWGENFKFTVNQNLLHIKFDRTEELPDEKETEIKFIQDIVVAKDGFVKYYLIDLNNLEVDIDFSVTGIEEPLIKAKGTADGTVKCVTSLEEK